jgi:hypothetical protein
MDAVKQTVNEVVRSYYETRRASGDLMVEADAPVLLPLVETALAQEGVTADAGTLATEIEGNITTGHYKLSTEDDLLIYLFFGGMVLCVYFWFKYKIAKS